MTEFVIFFLRVFTLFGIATAILLFGALFYKTRAHRYIAKRALLFSFLVAFVAMAGSLFFSEVAGFTPCELCWLQRIFMYPQVFLLGAGLLRNDKNVLNYTIVLSAVGLSLAAYHYGLNWYGLLYPLATCPISNSADCVTAHFTWGFMNIPLMSVTAFSLLILLFIYFKKNDTATHNRSTRAH